MDTETVQLLKEIAKEKKKKVVEKRKRRLAKKPRVVESFTDPTVEDESVQPLQKRRKPERGPGSPSGPLVEIGPSSVPALPIETGPNSVLPPPTATPVERSLVILALGRQGTEGLTPRILEVEGSAGGGEGVTPNIPEVEGPSGKGRGGDGTTLPRRLVIPVAPTNSLEGLEAIKAQLQRMLTIVDRSWVRQLIGQAGGPYQFLQSLGLETALATVEAEEKRQHTQQEIMALK